MPRTGWLQAVICWRRFLGGLVPDAITNGSVLATKGGCFALWFWLELPIVWNLSAACRSLGYAAIYNNCMIYVSIIYRCCWYWKASNPIYSFPLDMLFNCFFASRLCVKKALRNRSDWSQSFSISLDVASILSGQQWQSLLDDTWYIYIYILLRVGYTNLFWTMFWSFGKLVGQARLALQSFSGRHRFGMQRKCA